MEDTESFTAEQAAAANKVLRAAVGLAPQTFSKEQFVGMISEEIEQLRAAGHTDGDIAQLLAREVGVRVDPDSIRRYYADSVERLGYP